MIDTNSFIKDFNPTTSYILGLLWADGYINNGLRKNQSGRHNEIILKNKISDFIHFKEILFRTGEWKISYISKPTPEAENQGRATVRNREVLNFLIDHDYKVKSFVSADKILSKIPEPLHKFWFLGLFDGDGHFGFKEGQKGLMVAICSGYNQNWEYVEKLYKKLGIQYSINRQADNRPNRTGGSTIRITNRTNALKFGHYIYDNIESEKLCLKRKQERYLTLKSIIDIKYKKRITNSIYPSDDGTNRYKVHIKSGNTQKYIGLFNSLTEAIEGKQKGYLSIFGKEKHDEYYGLEIFDILNKSPIISNYKVEQQNFD